MVSRGMNESLEVDILGTSLLYISLKPPLSPFWYAPHLCFPCVPIRLSFTHVLLHTARWGARPAPGTQEDGHVRGADPQELEELTDAPLS